MDARRPRRSIRCRIDRSRAARCLLNSRGFPRGFPRCKEVTALTGVPPVDEGPPQCSVLVFFLCLFIARMRHKKIMMRISTVRFRPQSELGGSWQAQLLPSARTIASESRYPPKGITKEVEGKPYLIIHFSSSDAMKDGVGRYGSSPFPSPSSSSAPSAAASALSLSSLSRSSRYDTSPLSPASEAGTCLPISVEEDNPAPPGHRVICWAFHFGHSLKKWFVICVGPLRHQQ